MNPALDKSTTIQDLVPEKKMRCTNLQVDAGGGGINVSKVIQELEGETTALFPSGGLNGKMLEQMLIAKGLQSKVIPIKGETRESFAAISISTNEQYRFVLPGPELSNEELNSCYQAIESFKPVPGIIIFSGSLPPETPDEFMAKLASLARSTGAKFIADTSGDTLKQAVNEGVYLLKPSLSELCFLVGKQYLELSEVEDAARSIIDKGSSEVIVVSMGPSGALLLTKNISKQIPAPDIKKASSVGAGDSMVAGMALKLSQNRPLIEVVQFGVACGSAATMNAGSQLCKKEDVYKLFEWITTNTE